MAVAKGRGKMAASRFAGASGCEDGSGAGKGRQAGQAAAVVSCSGGEKSPFPGSVRVRCTLEAARSAWLPFSSSLFRVAFCVCFGVGWFVCGRLFVCFINWA